MYKYIQNIQDSVTDLDWHGRLKLLMHYDMQHCGEEALRKLFRIR